MGVGPNKFFKIADTVLTRKIFLKPQLSILPNSIAIVLNVEGSILEAIFEWRSKKNQASDQDPKLNSHS